MRAISVVAAALALAGQAPVDHPSVSVNGQTYTPASILTRNMGTAADQETAFPPHKVIGNIYYVGTRTLSSFLIATPEGHLLLDTTFERNAGVIRKSIESLGFKITDIKLIIGNHAHGDHQEGDAIWKEMTGARVLAMAEDVPALAQMMPGGKKHPIDGVLHDNDTVNIGGTKLYARLTAGHTRGATTFTAQVTDAGKTYDVVFFSSLRAGGTITPAIAEEFDRTFLIARALPCDVPLGDHPAEYGMQAKYAKVAPGAPNPFVDKANCFAEVDIQQAMYRAVLAEQRQKP